MASRRDKHMETGGGTAVEDAPATGTSERARGTAGGSTSVQQRPQGTGLGLANRGGRFPTDFPANPWELMRRMTEDLTGLFDSFGVGTRADTGRTGVATWAPRIELERRNDALVVRADLPGMGADDVDVSIEDGQLVISGERTQEQREERDSVVRTELVYGGFHRAIPLPQGADESEATAIFRNGTLEIVIPVSERNRGRRINVQGQGQEQRKGQGQAQEARR